MTDTETWVDVVKTAATAAGRPEPTAAEIQFILWERTAYPFGDEPTVREQIVQFFNEEAQ